MISKISSTCFGQSFAHLQERKTEIFTAYGIVSGCCGRQGFGERQRSMLPLSVPLSTTTTGHCTIRCKNLSLALLKMVKNWPKHVELILEINKLLLLHLVGFYTRILLYLNCLTTFTVKPFILHLIHAVAFYERGALLKNSHNSRLNFV